MIPIPRRPGLVGGVLMLLVALVPLGRSAGAHVEPTTPAGEAARRAEVGFVPTHGCGTAPTIGIDIQLPDGVVDPIPAELDGWTASVGERFVSWDGGPLPDGDEATFLVDVLLPDTPGVTLHFATIQRCPSDESLAWVQQPGDGTDQSYPAPAIAVVEATGAPGTTTPPSTDPASAVPTTGSDGAVTTTTEPTSTTVPVSTPAPEAVLVESASDSGGDPFLPVLFALVGVLVVGSGAFFFFSRRGTD